MPKLWLTYAWKDNEDEQVDFVIEDLRRAGIEVGFDRARLVVGQRLWPNIDREISDPTRTDGWAIYVTENSLSSEPCREELEFALRRALETRGGEFPLIGIFPEPIDRALIPSAIATRLFVDLKDPDWAAKILAGLKGVPLSSRASPPPNLIVKRHDGFFKSPPIIFEVRPRAGRWYPVLVLVPSAELEKLKMAHVGPSGRPPSAAMVSVSPVTADGGKLAGNRVHHSVDNQNSVYIGLSELPSILAVGGDGSDLWQVFPPLSNQEASPPRRKS